MWLLSLKKRPRAYVSQRFKWNISVSSVSRKNALCCEDHEYDPDTEVNPFLHIFFHAAVENQVTNRNPIEAYQFYNAMRRKKCSHHDAMHLIARILTPLVYDVIAEKKAFDLNTYKALLKKYKSRKPHKILKLLDNENDLS